MKRGLLIFGIGYLVGATAVQFHYLTRLGTPMFKAVNSPEYPTLRAQAEERAKARVAESMQGLATALREAMQNQPEQAPEPAPEPKSEQQFKTIIRNENPDL